MVTRSEWLYDVERETAAIYVGIDTYHDLNIDDQRAVICYMRESAAKLTELLENTEQTLQGKREPEGVLF